MGLAAIQFLPFLGSWGWILPAGLAGVAGLWWIRIPLRRARSRQRLQPSDSRIGLSENVPRYAASELSRRRWLAYMLVAPVVGLCFFVLDLGPLLSVSIGAVLVSIGWQIEALWYERNCEKLESALASAVDLVVAALFAGTSIQEALATAASRSKSPLRGWLDELIERLRLGESPPLLFSELAERVPLEGYRLFSIALSTSWESGGRYGEALARAARAMRDRLALRRRVRSQSVETRFSMFGVLGLTWVLFTLAYNSEPERIGSFIRSELGSFLLSGALLLEALGIVWIDRLTREEL